MLKKEGSRAERGRREREGLGGAAVICFLSLVMGYHILRMRKLKWRTKEASHLPPPAGTRLKTAVTFPTTESKRCLCYIYFVPERWMLIVNLAFIIAKESNVLYIVL